MDKLDELLNPLLAAWDAGDAIPEGTKGLENEVTYALQMRTLEHRLAAGDKHVGWKLGQTNRALRLERSEAEPAPGFLLASLARESAATVDTAGDSRWFVEPELILVMGADIKGADTTADHVREAVAGMACGFELVYRRAGWDDRSLQRAVNGSTAGHVMGPMTQGCLSASELDDLRVVTHNGAQTYGPLRGGDATDNPLDSVAWLVSFLARYERGLRQGDVILTGTYSGLLPMSPGQHWRGEVGDLQPVELHIK